MILLFSDSGVTSPFAKEFHEKSERVSEKSVSKTTFQEAVHRYADPDRVSFHVPGHKGRSEHLFWPEEAWGPGIWRSDLTELPGLDDLHAPGGVIREAQERMAALFGAEESMFLANGSTSGIAAAVAACAGEGDRILLEAGCHASAGNGLIISGASPCFLREHIDPETGIPAGISLKELEDAFQRYEGIKAVVLTHPSYYGTYSDLEKAAEIVHEHDAVLIVDEAHGAQLQFLEHAIPTAMAAGADLSVQSIHKMLGSLTQSSVLHMKGDRLNRERVRFFCRLMTSTSPSYLLLQSLDAVGNMLSRKGSRLWGSIQQWVKEAGEALNQIDGITWISSFTNAEGILQPVEPSRLILSAAGRGISGITLARILSDEYGIDGELSDGEQVILLAGSGSRAEDFSRLIDAVKEISASSPVDEFEKIRRMADQNRFLRNLSTEMVMTPREAVMAPCAFLEPESAAGEISARDLSVYPPGVPFVHAGDRLTGEIIHFIREGIREGLSFHGFMEDNDGEIRLACAQSPQQTMLMECIF